jgi:hypothetical protein
LKVVVAVRKYRRAIFSQIGSGRAEMPEWIAV